MDRLDCDDFLIREGLDLLAAFRQIRCENARRAVIVMIASIVEAEEVAVTLASQTPDGSGAMKTPSFS